MKYEVFTTEQATADLRAIFEYIAYDLLAGQNALNQLDRLEQAILSLDEMPERYHLYDKEPWKKRNLRIMSVKLMGEMIALQALRTVKKFDMKVADRLYIGLIKDLHHMGEIDYIVSDGYDVAQTAICFLYQFFGHTANEICGKDKQGKEITIKLACYREVDHFINLLRNRPDRRGTVVESIDFTDYKALPMDPVNCFEHEQTDYSKYDELVGALQLSALEVAILNCYMNGMRQAEVCAELGISRGTINHRKASIRQRY